MVQKLALSEFRVDQQDPHPAVGVGEVAVFAEQSSIGSLDLTVGVGSADISPRPRGQSSSGFLFLGNEIFWDDGDGDAHYSIEVGVGEIEIRLED